MKRGDEEICKTQFEAFLKRFFTVSQIIWKEVAQQDEPPDYYLLLDDTKFAVEVTTLMEKVPVGTSTSLPCGEIRNILHQFVREVESVAKTRGYLQGNYCVFFSNTH